MSTGLSHLAITISGAITWQIKFKDNLMDLGNKQAKLLNKMMTQKS